MPKFTLKSTNKKDLTSKVIEFEHSAETKEDHQKLLDLLKSDTEYKDLYVNIQYTDGVVSQLYATNNPNYKLESPVVWTSPYGRLKLYIDEDSLKLHTDADDKLHCELNLPGLIICNCSETLKHYENMLLEVFPFIKGRYKKIYWKVYTNFFTEYKEDNKE